MKIAMTIRKLSCIFVELFFEDLYNDRIDFAANYDPNTDKKQDASDWYMLQAKQFGDHDATVIGLSEIGLNFCGSFFLEEEQDQYDEDEYDFATNRICKLITDSLDCSPDTIVLVEIPRRNKERALELVNSGNI